jgi:hypothetical protein
MNQPIHFSLFWNLVFCELFNLQILSYTIRHFSPLWTRNLLAKMIVSNFALPAQVALCHATTTGHFVASWNYVELNNSMCQNQKIALPYRIIVNYDKLLKTKIEYVYTQIAEFAGLYSLFLFINTVIFHECNSTSWAPTNDCLIQFLFPIFEWISNGFKI